VQEGGCVRINLNERDPVRVSEETKQTGETRPTEWDWVERSVWTERMLEALEKGVKGGVWFSLIDKVYRPTTLYAGWLKVKARKGKAGSDRQSIEDFERNLEANLDSLHRELTEGSYRPRPIWRKYIDKPGSKEKRPLGIPCVRDRVVQAALCLVLEPIFENEFATQSYGFRPRRGCKDALREVDRLLKDGYVHVVDADLKAYFDSIPHDRLMNEVRKYVADSRVLELLETFLKQDILEGLTLWSPEQGTPQGAVISPLLANLYLHSVDVAMTHAGFHMVRYADDFVILCLSRQGAEAALAKVHELVAAKGLTLHPEKTRLVDVRVRGVGFDFLGYHFERRTRWPRKKSRKKLKDTIRDKTRRSNGHSLSAIIADVNVTLRGWFEYFKHSNRRSFPPLDGWIRRRLRSILRTRAKSKGISRGYDNIRWPKRFFRDHGFFSLEDAHRALLQSS
jgi:RNA-directed DNA polymerase